MRENELLVVSTTMIFMLFSIWLLNIFGYYVLIIYLIFIIWLYYTKYFGAQYVPSSDDSIDKMLELAKPRKNVILYDLGSGDGRILVKAVKKYKIKAIGVEIDPIRVAMSKLHVLIAKQRKNVRILRNNFFNVRLNNADFVTLFLLPETLEKLKDKFKKELKKGCIVVSNRFKINGWKPIKSDEENRVYVYKMR